VIILIIVVLTSKGDAQGTTQNFVEIKDLFDFKDLVEEEQEIVDLDEIGTKGPMMVDGATTSIDINGDDYIDGDKGK
jgi:hypothetical protein